MTEPIVSKKLLPILERLANEVKDKSFAFLTNLAKAYCESTLEKSKTNPMINKGLVIAIFTAFQKAGEVSNMLTEVEKYWLKGAISYFYNEEDESPDLDSFIGFEDDAEVLNACLKFAHLEKFCIKIEDYD